jgi:predicted transcriptional regulator
MPQHDRYDIVRSILKTIYNGNTESRIRNYLNETGIRYLAGLTFSQTNGCLKELIGLEFLELLDFRPHSYYGITEKGRRYALSDSAK